MRQAIVHEMHEGFDPHKTRLVHVHGLEQLLESTKHNKQRRGQACSILFNFLAMIPLNTPGKSLSCE